MENHILLLVLIAITCTLAASSDPLQDFCVADFTSPVLVNGNPCMDPKLVKADHFFVSGLHIDGSTSNPFGTNVNRITVNQIPGLNTLGLSTVHVNYAEGGIVPFHIHPRATEILTVLEGNLSVGFVTSNPENRLISKVLKKGDVFVFPLGLVHFQQNVGHGNVSVIAFLSSPNPGVIPVADSVFGSKPPIPDNILAKAFQVDNKIIDDLQSQF